MSDHGVKGIIYRFFCRKERQLYAVSDHIGCMSQANADYIIANHSELNPHKVGICPNCIEIVDKSVDAVTRKNIRRKNELADQKQDGKVYDTVPELWEDKNGHILLNG